MSKEISISGFALLRKVIGFKNKLAPLSRPIRSKTKTNRESLTNVLPRFTLATCIYFKFGWYGPLDCLARSFVIGQSENFGFGSATLYQKIALYVSTYPRYFRCIIKFHQSTVKQAVVKIRKSSTRSFFVLR